MIDFIGILVIWFILGFIFAFVFEPKHGFINNYKEALYVFLSGPLFWLLYFGKFVCYSYKWVREWFGN